MRRSDQAAYLAIAARNLFTLFNALVFPAALALYLLGEYGDALAVSGMALTNLLLGLVQEVRAKRHLDRLTLLAETRVRVRRDGQVQEIRSGDVVQGDLLLLSAGDTVVADGSVVEARFLEVDEALLTSESDPVPRRAGDHLLSGSFCVAGEGSYRAEQVGIASFAQRTAGEARSYRYSASPIQHSINRLLVLLTAIAVALCVSYGVMYQLHEVTQNDLWKMIAATITSMVPQGLVVMATFAFVLGAVRLSRRGALVHRLSAVETMASIDTLCLDKTGTLTTNRLHLEKLHRLDEKLADEALRERLRLFVAASLDRSSKSLAALREAVGETPCEILDQLPFKSQNRYSAVRVRQGAGQHVFVLGACEALRPYLEPTSQWESAWHELLTSGWRLLLFAESVNAPEGPFAGSLAGHVLRPLALVALGDELRPEARSVLEDLARQGIGCKILSGDNAETVCASVAPLAEGTNAPAIKALVEMPSVSGAELEATPQPAELIRSRCVFGRVSPRQKVQIIAALKAQGRHIAMIGDGVNDVLAIKNAHLGIAMGDGAAASKTVSGIVLETNDFALLPETLDEGRTIIRNLRRAGKIFLVKNVFTLILVLGALGVLGLPFPYQPRQVTLLNFLTIGAPTFFLMLKRERAASATASRFLRDIGWFALRTGFIIGVAGLFLYGLSNRVWKDNLETQQTLLLSLLVVLGLTTVWRALTDGEKQPLAGDRRYRWLTVGLLLLYLAVLYCPLVNDFFKLTPLSFGQWKWVLTFAAGAIALLGLSDRVSRSRLRATSAATRPGD